MSIIQDKAPEKIHKNRKYKRESVGKLAAELLAKSNDTHTAGEQTAEQLTDYEKNVHECVEDSKKKYPGNFYVVVLTKTERLMRNVIRHFYLGRETCPTPTHDQTVYKYFRKCDRLDFLWVVPDKLACQHLRNNALIVPTKERKLLEFVLDFYDGSLDKKAMVLNNEV